VVIVALDDTKPITREDISFATWVGDGRNRFYDKHQCKSSLSIPLTQLNLPKVIVYENGRSGFLGEHSCMDGTPTLRLNEFILASIATGKADLGPERTGDTGRDLPDPTEITFILDEKSRENIKAAEQRFDELVANHDLHVWNFGIPTLSLFTYTSSGTAIRRLRKRIHQDV
jgi:carnitine O-acetyltransferase